ncbi:MAG: VOC family protein [Planctomycetota bacterium]
MIEGIHHVGVAVSDLAAAMRVWDGILGQTARREEVAAQKVRTASYPCGVELLEATGPESPIARFLKARGPGIHHVTLSVRGLDAHLRRLESAGVRLVHPTAVPGAGGSRIAFLHPSATGGVLVELKEHE